MNKKVPFGEADLIKNLLEDLKSHHDWYFFLLFLYRIIGVTQRELRCLLEHSSEWVNRDDPAFDSVEATDHRQASDYVKLSYFQPRSAQVLPKSLRIHLPFIIRFLVPKPELWVEYDCIRELPNRQLGFVGRSKELGDLRRLFTRKISRVMLTSVSLEAIGGQGKSVLALEFAHRSFSDYSCIFWMDLNASNSVAQLETFCINRCGIESYNNLVSIDGERKTEYYWRMISQRFRKKCLFVLDDVSNENAVSRFLPQQKTDNIHFILTSRKQTLKIKVEPMPIAPLNSRDAGELFVQRSGLTTLAPTDTDVQNLVIKTLGGHALSIALIASYAKLNGVTDLIWLKCQIDELGTQNIDPNMLVDGYPRPLVSTFELSFNSLSAQARILLLLFALFPRVAIPQRVYKESVRQMLGEDPLVQQLVQDFVSAKPSSLNELFKNCLVEHRGEKNNDSMLLHEVIYDFVRCKWGSLWKTEPDLRAIESAFIVSATKFARSLVQRSEDCESTLKAGQDLTSVLRAVTGLLMPIIDDKRSLYPSHSRVNLSLKFWFENYRFQQYVYDTEIQEFLLPNLESMQNYLREQNLDTRINEFIVCKLLGHAYYSSPKDKGKDAEKQFRRALDLAANLESEHRNQGINYDVTIAWYEIFLIDHLVNVASKNRSEANICVPIKSDPKFCDDINRLEALFPESLLDVNQAIVPKDYSLLLRAAHYWGHRGNQDSYGLLCQLKQGKTNSKTSSLITDARGHYIQAVNYRLAALRLFFPRQYVNDYGVRLNKLPHVRSWILEIEKVSTTQYMEDFTLYFQGIGDTAHQYRGMNFVDALDVCYLLSQKKYPPATKDLKSSYQAAEKLWQYASYTSVKNRTLRKEPPIKYVLWMCSSYIIKQLLIGVIKNEQLPAWNELENQIADAIENKKKQLGITYAFGESEQQKQVLEIWQILQRGCS